MNGKRLYEYQREINIWQMREFPATYPLKATAKVAEEAGELLGEAIKETEERTDSIDRNANARKELGDVLISAIHVAAVYGWNVEDVLAERWAEVGKRRFKSA